MREPSPQKPLLVDPSFRVRWRRRLRARGFSHISLTIEAAGVMGWFVMTVLSEKYLNDATTSRRAAENAAEQASVSNASSFCQGGGAASNTLGNFEAHGSSDVFSNGMPQLTPAQIPSLISMVGISSLKTLPVYFQQFQGSKTSTTAQAVTSTAPHNQVTSGQFQGVRDLACLEKSLESPGAPWLSIAEARQNVFTTNIQGY
jgi:hypothetical protein